MDPFFAKWMKENKETMKKSIKIIRNEMEKELKKRKMDLRLPTDD